jgi:hypothetical protein
VVNGTLPGIPTEFFDLDFIGSTVSFALASQKANPINFSGPLRVSTSDEVQKRNAFAACAAFRIEGLEASLDRAREIAFQGELDAVGHHIEEAQGYLAQIRLLHQEALDEFCRAQGE